MLPRWQWRRQRGPHQPWCSDSNLWARGSCAPPHGYLAGKYRCQHCIPGLLWWQAQQVSRCQVVTYGGRPGRRLWPRRTSWQTWCSWGSRSSSALVCRWWLRPSSWSTPSAWSWTSDQKTWGSITWPGGKVRLLGPLPWSMNSGKALDGI